MFSLVRKAGKALFSSDENHHEVEHQQQHRNSHRGGHIDGEVEMVEVYYPGGNGFSRTASKTSFHGYRGPHPVIGYYPTPPPMMPYRRKRPPPPPRTCAYECQNILALLGLCVSIIVKGVAFGNSHWTNHDEIEFNNNKEQFPIMTNFIDMKNGKYDSNCDDMKCKIFFDKYSALQTVAQAQGKPAVPLRGSFSRGVNSRCETVQLTGAASSDLVGASVLIGSSSGSAKYEKCVVDKQTEVNEYRTIRFLLITSMCCDGLAIIAWIILFVKPTKANIIRLCLVIAALLGFISALLTALSLGLFAQAVDLFDDPRMTLGWPFYITAVAGFLALVSTGLAGGLLYRERRRDHYSNAKIMPRHNMSPTVSIVEMDNGGPTIIHENPAAIEAGDAANTIKAIAPPSAPSLLSRTKSKDTVNTLDVDAHSSSGQLEVPPKRLPPLPDDYIQRLRREDPAMRSYRSATERDDRDDPDRNPGYRRGDPIARSTRSAFNQAI